MKKKLVLVAQQLKGVNEGNKSSHVNAPTKRFGLPLPQLEELCADT